MTTQDQSETPGRSLRDRVQDVIEQIRPLIQQDGGDLELVDVSEGGEVRVRLRGACVGCPMAQMTMTQGVEQRIRQEVPEVSQVIQVPPV